MLDQVGESPTRCHSQLQLASSSCQLGGTQLRVSGNKRQLAANSRKEDDNTNSGGCFSVKFGGLFLFPPSTSLALDVFH